MAKRPRPPSPEKAARAQAIGAMLQRKYPAAKCSLEFRNPLQLLIATILSAQCTDARVNQVTPGLFAAYPDAQALAQAELADVERLIQSTGFYRNKARAIVETCRELAAKHDGRVPRTMDELIQLRGVGRKTANVLLGNAYGIPGMVVDTHVGRLSRRLGFTRHAGPEKVEQDLMQLFPPERWTKLAHELILLGRAHCKAPTPRCDGCPLLALCPFTGKRFITAK
jgi:endonuclease-3